MIVGVVADDLTGANDTGVQFSKRGVAAVVAVDAVRFDAAALAATVVVVDTVSRELPPREAAAICHTAVGRMVAAGAALIYKKIDSTLRGNVAAEIWAALAASGSNACLVAPAYPATGRITIGGYQLVGQSLAAPDDSSPAAAAAAADVPALLAQDAPAPVGYLTLRAVRAPAAALIAEIRGRVGAGQRLLVADALTDDDLGRAARAYRAADVGALLAGCAGLAAAVPDVWNLVPSAPSRAAGTHGADQPTAEEHGADGPRGGSSGVYGEPGSGRDAGEAGPAGPVVVLAGSLHAATRRQLLTLAAVANPPRWLVLAVPEEASPELFAREAARLRAELADQLRRGHDVVVSTYAPGVLLPARPPDDAAGRRVRAAINALFAEFAAAALAIAPGAALIVTGGDVADAVFRALGVEGVAIRDEVAPGVPYGRCVGGPHDGLSVVTKAGGFGGDAALVEALTYSKKEGGRRGHGA